jgi:charged multivesicular body protein 4
MKLLESRSLVGIFFATGNPRKSELCFHVSFISFQPHTLNAQLLPAPQFVYFLLPSILFFSPHPSKKKTMPLFTTKKREPSPQEMMATMKETLQMLEKREEFLQKKVDTQIQEAKVALQKKDKKKAMVCLKKKKLYDAEIEKLGATRVNLETQIMAIENGMVTMSAMEAMKIGATAMKRLNNHMKIEDVDEFMQDIQEQFQLAEEISNAIATPLGGPFDEDDLLAELEELTAEDDLEKEILGPVPLSLPKVPTKEPAPTKQAKQTKPTRAKTEDDELEALAASLA